MGFWLFAGIEFLYAIFFILIAIFSSMALADAKDGKKDAKDNNNDKDRDNYDKAINLLGWCVGIGWTLVAVAVIAIILSIFGAPEEAAASLAAGGAETMSTEALVAQALNYKKMLGEANFSKLQEVFKFAGRNRNRAPDMIKHIDELNEHLKQEKNGLLYYNRVFGMTGIIGTIEKVLLWTSAALLFGVSVTAAAAAGYIGRTSTKMGYDAAITAALIGIFPFSIMVIWGFSNAIYKHQKSKQVDRDEAAILNAKVNRRGVRPPPPQYSPRRAAPPPPVAYNSQYSPRRAAPPPPAQYSPRRAAPPPPVKQKSTTEQGINAAHSVVDHADKAHKVLTSLQGSVDPNSSHGQLLSSATDILNTIKSQKSTINSIESAIK